MKIIIQHDCPVCKRNRRAGDHTKCAKITQAKHAVDKPHKAERKLPKHTVEYLSYLSRLEQ